MGPTQVSQSCFRPSRHHETLEEPPTCQNECMVDDIMLSGDDNMQVTMVTASCSFHFNISVTLSETGNMFPLPLWF